MAHTKSAMKRMRQDRKRRLHNRMEKSRLHTTIRHFREALAQKDQEKSLHYLRLAVSYLDKAVKHGTIHHNKSARLKSRLQQHFNRCFSPNPV